MATPAAVGEKMGSSNFSKQPGSGPERSPGRPWIWSDLCTQEQGACAKGSPPPRTLIRPGAQVSFSLGLSSSLKVETPGRRWGGHCPGRWLNYPVRVGWEPSILTSRPRLFGVTGGWRTAPGQGYSPWPSFCSQSHGLPPLYLEIRII